MITSYEALDLGRFMKIDHILHTPAEDIDKQVQIVAILADMTEAEVLSLPLSDYSAMAAKIGFLGTLCAPADVDGSAITAGEFTLIPVRDFTKINTAQYVDFQTLITAGADIPQLLSCFLVPEGRQYNEGYDIGAVQEAVLSLPLATAIGLTAFFFSSFSASIRDTLGSLELKTKDPKTRAEIVKIGMRAETVLRGIGAGLPT